MKLLDRFSSDPLQRTFLTGNSGERIVMNMRYMPTQKMWIADFERGGFIAKGIAVVSSPNLLRGFHNIIPFGICVQTLDGQDPRGIEDWINGYAFMYLMSMEEVLALESEYFE